MARKEVIIYQGPVRLVDEAGAKEYIEKRGRELILQPGDRFVKLGKDWKLKDKEQFGTVPQGRYGIAIQVGPATKEESLFGQTPKRNSKRSKNRK